jgi:Ca-activated chloride channel family protein
LPDVSPEGEIEMTRWNRAGITAAGWMVAILVAGCSGTAAPAAATPSPTATPTAVATPTPTPTTATATPTASPPAATGPAAIEAPAEVPAGATFAASWTGPNGNADYVTIVATGTERWTNEPYFYTRDGPSGSLLASTTSGAYELWYVSGTEPNEILVRRSITIKPFEGTVVGPDSVGAATTFEATWTGPNGPGDYVTIVAVGAERWLDESYFYTSVGSPGDLIAPLEAGAYELWYVAGTDRKTMVRRPITVTPVQVTLTAPADVARNATFQVAWTGPDGPRDYITIVPAGSVEGAYASYAYTSTGSPVTLTAPAAPGNYEIWYASDRTKGTFKSIPIVVR